MVSILIKRRQHASVREYLIPFVTFRIFFAIAFVLIHVFYFGGGDTFVYFDLGSFYADQIKSSPFDLFNLYAADYGELKNIKVFYNYYAITYLKAADSMLMGKIVGILNLFTGNHFLCSTIIFSLLCSIGLWQIFITVSEIYPQLKKYFAIGILYYPTVAIWSSGILKDPLAMLAIGLIFRATYLMCRKRRFLLPLIFTSISIYFCLGLKPYILYTFIPAMFLWAYGLISERYNNLSFKLLVAPLILILFTGGVYFMTYQISEGSGKYSFENMETSVRGFHSWHQYLADNRDQSGYTLGEIEYTPIGILKKAPEAIFVTFFRPMLFVDTRNASTLFEGIQSFILLIMTIWVIFKVGLRRLISLLIFNPNIRAFMVFALLFGFAVGFTSYNFGALSRYKIPALPFYAISLTIIWYLGKRKDKKNTKAVY